MIAFYGHYLCLNLVDNSFVVDTQVLAIKQDLQSFNVTHQLILNL